MSMSKCAFCSTPAQHACYTCNSVVYCAGRVCFENDRPLHDALCNSYKRLLNGPRPSPSSKLGVLFPEYSKEPQLIWVECTQIKLEDDGTIFEDPSVATHLGADDPASIARTVTTSTYSVNSAIFYCKNNKESDETKVNICLSTILDGKPPSQWRGPLVVLSLTGGERFHYQDIRLTDPRVALDFMIKDSMDFNINTYSSNPEMLLHCKPTTGVRINCEGDRRVNNMAHFVKVYLKPDRSHPIYQELPTHVSMALGFPILVQRYPPGEEWKDKKDVFPNPYNNPAAMWMNLDIDADGSNWGNPDPKWQSDIGSVLIVEQNGQDISPREVCVLWQYCQFQLAYGKFVVLMDKVDEKTLKKGRRALNRDYVTKAAIEKFFEKHKVEISQRSNNPWGKSKGKSGFAL